MAGKDRGPSADLKERVLREGDSFAFYQAVRLLRLFATREKRFARDHDPVRECVRIKPNLSLGHPSTEIESIRRMDEEGPLFGITANFLGIYGESSPLPAFYTEDLIDEGSEGRTAAREFLDLVNYPIYLIFFKIWEKYRIYLRVTDEKDPKYLDILYSLMGMPTKSVRSEIKGAFHLLKYMGLLSQFPKSALGLRTLLADALDEPDLTIEPCIERKVSIPEDQRCRLGSSANQLGEECYIGSEIKDRSGKFRVKISPVKAGNFRQLLPDTPKYKRMALLANVYLNEPMEMDLEMVLSPGEVQTTGLGGMNWARLGVDTWMFSQTYNEPVRAVFELR